MLRRASAFVLLTVARTIVVAGELPSHLKNAVDYEDRWERDRKPDPPSKPAGILPLTGVEPGMVVLDLFSGGGY